MATMYFGDQEQDMDFEAMANQIAAGGQGGITETPYAGRPGMGGGIPGGNDRFQRPRYPRRPYEPVVYPQPGKPPSIPEPAEPPVATPAYDFWGAVTALIGGEDGVADTDIAMLKELWEQDPKWKAPTTAKAKRLIGIATTLKKLGYEDQLGDVLGALFDMGYSQPAFSLSMFNRLLQPYGLGVNTGGSSSKASSSDTAAMLAELGL